MVEQGVIMHGYDVQISTLLQEELQREEKTINLIASENYASKAILQATGSVLTNKYAEGYPTKRYYSGCQVIDQVEVLAQERCKKLFGAQQVNVQPHAGSQANMAVYFSVLQPGDTIMGMSLAEGGHLTHGHPVNFSGKIFNAVQYSVDPTTHLLNYEDIARKAAQYKPKMIVCGASAYPRTIDFKKFHEIAQSVNALLVADIAHIAGLVATGLHQSPIEYADFVTSTTHKTLRGPRGGLVMSKQQFGSAVDRAIMPGMQGGPFMHVIAAKAIAFFEALQPNFVEYQRQVIANAALLAQLLIEKGYMLTTGGTDNHLMVVDLRSRQLNGLQAQKALEMAGITVSRSTIPFDPEKPGVTSGIRLGTPALTTRGFKAEQIQQTALFIDEALRQWDNEQKLKQIREEVEKLCAQLPIYGSIHPTLHSASSDTSTVAL